MNLHLKTVPCIWLKLSEYFHHLTNIGNMINMSNNVNINITNYFTE